MKKKHEIRIKEQEINFYSEFSSHQTETETPVHSITLPCVSSSRRKALADFQNALYLDINMHGVVLI